MKPILSLAFPLCVVLSATPAFAQEAIDPESRSTSRAKSHVLRLNDGRVLRGKARSTESGWEFRQGREWILLPEGLVAQGTPESKLLAEARRVERSIERNDHTRRAAYAEWLAQQGLAVEALGELRPRPRSRGRTSGCTGRPGTDRSPGCASGATGVRGWGRGRSAPRGVPRVRRAGDAGRSRSGRADGASEG